MENPLPQKPDSIAEDNTLEDTGNERDAEEEIVDQVFTQPPVLSKRLWQFFITREKKDTTTKSVVEEVEIIPDKSLVTGYTIRWKIMLLGFGIGLFTIVLISGVLTWLMVAKTDFDLKYFKQQTINQKKKHLRDLVTTTYTAVESEYNSSLENQKIISEARHKLKSNSRIIQSYLRSQYQQSLTAKNSKQAKKRAQQNVINFIKNINQDVDQPDYAWINTFSARNTGQVRMIFHPDMIGMEGKKVANYKYHSGPRKGQVVFIKTGIEQVPIFQYVNQLVRNQDEGTIFYEWARSLSEGYVKLIPTMSYVKLFKPWGWVIGTSTEKPKESSDIKQRIINMVRNLRYGPANTDYFWIHAFAPKENLSFKMIMHPTEPVLNGKDISNYRYSKGARKGEVAYATGISEKTPFFKQMNTIVGRYGEGLVEYNWSKPTSIGLTENESKISYVKLFKPLNWVIGTGTYVSDIELEINKRQKQLTEQLIDIGKVVLISYLIILICTIIAIIIVSHRITKPIKSKIFFLKEIAQGRGALTEEVESDANDETAELAHWLNVFIIRVRSIVTGIGKSSTVINRGSEDLTDSIDKISNTTHKLTQLAADQSSATEETLVTMQKIQSGVERSAKYSKDADKLFTEAECELQKGVDASAKMRQSMKRINEGGQEVNKFIALIIDIADQTNMLALNAAIEAAKAGEQGRRFVVVADEMRRLAENSSKIVEQINDIIDANNYRIVEGEQAVKMIDQHLDVIKKKVDETSRHVNQISITTAEETIAIQEVNVTLSKLGESSSDVIDVADYIDKTIAVQLKVAGETTNESQKLMNQIKQFKV